MKKITGILMFVFILSLVACTPTEKEPKPSIEIGLETSSTSLEINESLDIKFTTNDPLGLNIVSSDSTVVEVIDQAGKVKALAEGSAIITLTSKTEESINKKLTITVNAKKEIVLQDNVLIDMNEDKESVVFNEITYLKGESLFKSFDDYLEVYSDKEVVINVKSGDYNFENEFNGDFEIYGHGQVNLEAKIGLLEGSLIIDGINFIKTSTITIKSQEKFVFTNNTVNTENSFLVIKNAINVEIINNNFNKVLGVAIQILDMINETDISIDKNIIENADVAFDIQSRTKLFERANIILYRNKINSTKKVFNIDLGTNNAKSSHTAYARFNEITNYEIAVEGAQANNFDFTLNFWGEDELNKSKFINVEDKFLLGSYKDVADFISEEDYNPKKPIFFDILNKIDLIELGDDHSYQYVILPYTAPQNIRWITSKPNYVRFHGNIISGIESQKITLTAYPSSNSDLKINMPLEITTAPGIHLLPDNIMNNMQVGDTFKIAATPFPFDRAEDLVTFESSNTNIATVDNNGNVTIKAVGLFTIIARTNEGIMEEISFESYETLSDDNLVDYVTSRQLNYAPLHEFIVYGAGFNFDEALHENVSRLLIQDIERKGEYIKISEGVRPGTKKNSNIDAKYKFNDENIVWIVIHETANTSPSSSALSHHNYLMGQANRGEKPFTSWHSTMDSEDLYQHIPFDEIAWHAGDGSNLPGQGNYFGGGNRNGIGIEMSVNQNGNILKTWQRTAKYAAEIMYEYDLPFSQLTYHNDFSGKECPQSMRRGGFVPLFEEYVKNELDYLHKFGTKNQITLKSNNLEYLDNNGVVIKNPTHSMTVSYELEITTDNGTITREFNVYLPGSWK